jgi:UDP-glucose 4-epimerase
LTVDGNGTQTRDFVYVGDIVGAIMHALHAARGGLYHLGTGVETSINRLAEVVTDVTDPSMEIVHRPARPNDPMRNFPDVSAARSNLGWLPMVTLRDGVARTAAWLADAAS